MDDVATGILYNIAMQSIAGRNIVIIAAAMAIFMCLGCAKPSREHGLADLNKDLELEARLSAANFALVSSDAGAVAESHSILIKNHNIPDTVPLEFAGKDVTVPGISTDDAVGMHITNGRLMSVYMFDVPHRPGYGEIIPLALAHYVIPSTGLEFVLLLVCFQYDTEGSNLGIGVRSVSLDGVETSAPFAIALKPEELAGKFFYDDFVGSGEVQAVAGRDDWDQGFLLLTRLDEGTILSTYLPWY